jgi:molybdopterin-guanine dinucleotide biosynthesis protein A
MNLPNRRQILHGSLAASLSTLFANTAAAESGGLSVAPFRFDVTPPEGHPLCGGWIKPVAGVDDGLEAIGWVLLGAGKPVVVCAVDWTGILNEAHLAWRGALAEAAGTTPDRVAVQCVHQHDAPFVCLRSEELLQKLDAGLSNVRLDFFQDCLKRGAAAVRAAITQARPLTHVASAEAKVEQVAGNRRLLLGPDGKVQKMRGSSCRDPELVALPEGLIDPMLKSVAFYSGAEKVLCCHYYACHPMSHYGRGMVSSDFPGLARKAMQQREPGCAHIYFTGAAGNIAAGKYNDGSPEARVRLTQRILDAMTAAGSKLSPQPVSGVSWQTQEILPEVNPAFSLESETAMMENPANTAANRIRPAMRVAWIERVEKKLPIILSALHVNDTTLLHLPAESFVEYQLRAQQEHPGRFVATAAYGDGGPWYIPTEEAFPQGGYEVSVANCAPATDPLMSHGIRALLKA